MSVLLVSHPDCVLHEMGSGHPESPKRLVAVLDALDAPGIGGRLTQVEAPLATEEALARVHEDAHIDFVHESAPEEDYAFLDPDTSLNPRSLPAALPSSTPIRP